MRCPSVRNAIVTDKLAEGPVDSAVPENQIAESRSLKCAREENDEAEPEGGASGDDPVPRNAKLRKFTYPQGMYAWFLSAFISLYPSLW